MKYILKWLCVVLLLAVEVYLLTAASIASLYGDLRWLFVLSILWLALVTLFASQAYPMSSESTASKKLFRLARQRIVCLIFLIVVSIVVFVLAGEVQYYRNKANWKISQAKDPRSSTGLPVGTLLVQFDAYPNYGYFFLEGEPLRSYLEAEQPQTLDVVMALRLRFGRPYASRFVCANGKSANGRSGFWTPSDRGDWLSSSPFDRANRISEQLAEELAGREL